MIVLVTKNTLWHGGRVRPNALASKACRGLPLGGSNPSHAATKM
jgi:hypothetical protein